MRKFVVVALSVVTFISLFAVGSVHTSAQSTPAATPNPDCNPGKVIDTFLKLRKVNDKDKDAATLQSVEDTIEAYKAACAGLSFKGTGLKVVGPFELPAGNYKVTGTAKDYLIVKLKLISGDCSTSDGSAILFNLDNDQASAGAETLMTSNDCKLVMSTENISSAWRIDFETMQ